MNNLFDIISLYFMINLGSLPIFLKLVSYSKDDSSYLSNDGSLFKMRFYAIYIFIGILFFPFYGFFKRQ